MFWNQKIWRNFVDNRNRSKVDDSYSTEVLRTKKFDGTLKFYRIFEINKSWYELFDRCFTNQKIRRNFESSVVLFEINKSWYEYDYRTKFCLTFRNRLSWYQLFENRTKLDARQNLTELWSFDVFFEIEKSCYPAHHVGVFYYRMGNKKIL